MLNYSGEPRVPMTLTLEDGSAFSGTSFGALKEVQGEVVFNTGMTGYVEALTDPSYKGQILALTYPLQGNYGVPQGPYEAPHIQVQGLIVSRYSDRPNHHAAVKTLGAWLEAEGIPAITGVDTRRLTRHLRELGTTPGAMELRAEAAGGSDAGERCIPSVDMTRVLDLVGSQEITRHGDGDPTILLVDTGSKENILRSLLRRSATVIRAPWDAPWEGLLHEADGVLLTNGPGDPMDARDLIERVKALLRRELPIFGVCFGHQVLALAAGARTYKLKYGHRSVNQPVRDVQSGRCYITSQNHGYAVQTESLPREWQPWFENLNDGTNEGIRHLHRPFFSVQFHPEASPGPNDTSFLFDEFLRVVAQQKAARPARTARRAERR